MNKLTGSLEDYLEAIYILSQKNSSVRITDIATFLSLSKPSVNRAVQTLKNNNYVNHEKYGAISLTNEGLIIAKDIDFRHKTITRFLIEKLQVNPQTAEQDACRIEHVISSETLNKLLKYSENQIK